MRRFSFEWPSSSIPRFQDESNSRQRAAPREQERARGLCQIDLIQIPARSRSRGLTLGNPLASLSCNIGPNDISGTECKLSQNSPNKLGLAIQATEVKSKQEPFGTQDSKRNRHQDQLRVDLESKSRTGRNYRRGRVVRSPLHHTARLSLTLSFGVHECVYTVRH